VAEPPTQPYWLRRPPATGRFDVADPSLIGEPEVLTHRATLAVELAGRTIPFELPVVHRFTDRVDGERYRALVVTPPVLVEMEEGVHLFPDASPHPVTLRLRRPAGPSPGALVGRARLALPAGWRSDPEAVAFSLAAGETRRVALEVTPPAGVGVAVALAQAELDGESERVVASGMHTIDYSHIPPQVLFPPAEARLVRLELRTVKRRIGYVMGAGDEVPEALRRIGYEVVLLDDERLASGELADLATIVVGVRAYNVRPALRDHNDRLLAWVERGGTLVAQYNTASRRGPELDGIGPYPFEISRERVSVETAPVTLVVPDHPVLELPNRIDAADFDGWVQERGLYFAGDWDERYTALLASHDPGEPELRGGLLVARYGDGVFIYTGYSFFRQLPVGVPGAFRLFVNLVEAGGAGAIRESDGTDPVSR
jgi:hypothetical protein